MFVYSLTCVRLNRMRANWKHWKTTSIGEDDSVIDAGAVGTKYCYCCCCCCCHCCWWDWSGAGRTTMAAVLNPQRRCPVVIVLRPLAPLWDGSRQRRPMAADCLSVERWNIFSGNLANPHPSRWKFLNFSSYLVQCWSSAVSKYFYRTPPIIILSNLLPVGGCHFSGLSPN